MQVGQEILKNGSTKAEKGPKSAALIFILTPNPSFSKPPGSLQPVEDRIKMLGETGIDYVIRHPFTRECRAITPQQFVSKSSAGKLPLPV